KEPLKTSAPFTFEEMQVWFETSENKIFSSTNDVLIKEPYLYSKSISTKEGRPDFRLQLSSPALTGADFTELSGFTPTTYIGAFDSTNDWTEKWTEWDADNRAY